MPLPKVNDWPAFRRHLKMLSDTFPQQFGGWVLIGGGACWFYRTMLERSADADFPAPDFSAAEEAEWLSKDIDFMGPHVKDGEMLLGAACNPDTHTIPFRGIEVDFLEEGIQLTSREATRSAREVRTPDFVFRVVDAVLLYAEKLAVVRSKERPQDRLHLRLLEVFLKCEFCREIETPDDLDSEEWLERAVAVKTAQLDFFARDTIFATRLQRGIKLLYRREHARIGHWAKHHLPGYMD